MKMNIDGLRKAFSSKKFNTLIFMVVSTYGMYAFDTKIPTEVALAVLGLASVYMGGQSYVDGKNS